jgi:hypothetical protein
VTIGTANFTFGDFGFDARPSTALREQVRYFVYFVTAHMVEFEDADIGIAAIDTGIRSEVGTYHLKAFRSLLGRLGATPTSVPFNRFNTMAVSATYFTLGDLSFNSGPVKAPGKQIGYSARFLPINVIKLKKTYICLTTINAGMSGEV